MNRLPCTTSVKGQKRKSSATKTTIALLSAKPGYRMKSYGPPSLLPLGNQTLLDIQIAAIGAVYKNYEIIVCCGFEANRVARYVKNRYKNLDIRIVENQLYDDSNCCETLRLCLNNVSTDSLMVCNGEILLFPELIKCYKDSPYLLTQKKSKKKSNLEIGSVVNDKGIITNISFGLPDLWSEIFYLHSKDSIELLRKIVSSDMYKNRLVFESLNELNRAKFNLEQIVTDYRIEKIDNIKTYHKIREKYENLGSELFLRSLN